ncbi:MAG: hypothetical protein Fur003_0930 [Candidatus Dojkabacteria bacterium]
MFLDPSHSLEPRARNAHIDFTVNDRPPILTLTEPITTSTTPEQFATIATTIYTNDLPEINDAIFTFNTPDTTTFALDDQTIEMLQRLQFALVQEGAEVGLDVGAFTYITDKKLKLAVLDQIRAVEFNPNPSIDGMPFANMIN